jgi:hypothetical protein
MKRDSLARDRQHIYRPRKCYAMHGGRLLVFRSLYERESYFRDHAFDDDLHKANAFEIRRRIMRTSDGKKMCMRPDGTWLTYR